MGRGMSYSDDTKVKALSLLENGMTLRDCARVVGVTKSTIHRWVNSELNPRRARKMNYQTHSTTNELDKIEFNELGQTGHYSVKEIVTPQRAADWLKYRAYEKQRKTSPAKIAFYAREMEMDRFKPYTSLDFGVLGRKFHLIDGQHRLLAVIKSGVSIPFSVNYYLCANERDLADLYTRTDVGRTRSIAARLEALGVRERLGLTQKQTNKFGAAVKFIYEIFMGIEPSNFIPEYYEVAMDYFALPYGQFQTDVRGAPEFITDSLHRRATTALALITYKFSSRQCELDKITHFWEGAAFDDGLRINDPRKLANRHLLTSQIDAGQVGRRAAQIVRARYSLCYLTNCFNAWFDNRSLTRTSVQSQLTPNIRGFSEKMLPPIE